MEYFLLVLIGTFDKILYTLSIRNLTLFVFCVFDKEAASLSFFFNMESYSDTSIVFKLVRCFGVMLKNTEEEFFIRTFDRISITLRAEDVMNSTLELIGRFIGLT